ncbi:hypothetical protein BaRGS_00013285 [Batillaria attramentaria]|uniref:Uncharacterized protein n=1 Tax=Batillaria attramentaria TaxID=370345 RepID=A0ABD0L810_9CAEN
MVYSYKSQQDGLQLQIQSSAPFVRPKIPSYISLKQESHSYRLLVYGHSGQVPLSLMTTVRPIRGPLSHRVTSLDVAVTSRIPPSMVIGSELQASCRLRTTQLEVWRGMPAFCARDVRLYFKSRQQRRSIRRASSGVLQCFLTHDGHCLTTRQGSFRGSSKMAAPSSGVNDPPRETRGRARLFKCARGLLNELNQSRAYGWRKLAGTSQGMKRGKNAGWRREGDRVCVSNSSARAVTVLVLQLYTNTSLSSLMVSAARASLHLHHGQNNKHAQSHLLRAVQREMKGSPQRADPRQFQKARIIHGNLAAMFADHGVTMVTRGSVMADAETDALSGEQTDEGVWLGS